MQSGPRRTTITVDKITTVIAIAIVTHTGCSKTIVARRPQPPIAVPLVLRTRFCPRSALFCICCIFCFSGFTFGSKLAIKSISRITCFCNGQKIHFICGILSTFCIIIWIVIIHNCCIFNCCLFCRCKCRILKCSIQPGTKSTRCPCYIRIFLIIRFSIQVLVCKQKGIISMYGQNLPFNWFFC